MICTTFALGKIRGFPRHRVCVRGRIVRRKVSRFCRAIAKMEGIMDDRWQTQIQMKIRVTVKPRAKKREVVKNAEGDYVVSVISPAEEGKANEEVINTVAKYFKLAKSRVKIVSGLKYKKKILEVL